jgi:hypothetical protein
MVTLYLGATPEPAIGLPDGSARGNSALDPLLSDAGNGGMSRNPLSNRSTTPLFAQARGSNAATQNREVAQAKQAMLKQLDAQLDKVLGPGKYTKPKNHREYTQTVVKAYQKLKSPEQRNEFLARIEAAGKPFRLNFGLSRVVNGKKVSLNSNVAGPLPQAFAAERRKFEAEFARPAAAVRPNPSPIDTRTRTPAPTTPYLIAEAPVRSTA